MKPSKVAVYTIVLLITFSNPLKQYMIPQQSRLLQQPINPQQLRIPQQPINPQQSIISYKTVQQQRDYDNFEHLIRSNNAASNVREYDNFRFLEKHQIINPVLQPPVVPVQPSKKSLNIDIFKINNITADKVEANRSSILQLQMNGLNISQNTLSVDSDVLLRINNLTISMKQIEELLEFNTRLINKCGMQFDYCQIIQKYDINKQVQQNNRQKLIHQSNIIKQQQQQQKYPQFQDKSTYTTKSRFKEQKSNTQLPFSEDELDQEVQELLGAT